MGFFVPARSPPQPVSTPEINRGNAQKSPWRCWHSVPARGGFRTFASLSQTLRLSSTNRGGNTNQHLVSAAVSDFIPHFFSLSFLPGFPPYLALVSPREAAGCSDFACARLLLGVPSSTQMC